MADDVEITLDPNLMKELHTLPEVISKTEEAAQKIAEAARAAAPVASGHYAASIRAERSNKKDSGVWIVAADDPQGWIEFGNTTHEGHYTLRNAVGAAGYGFARKRG